MSALDASNRPHLLRVGLRLEWLTVGWNLIEGVIAVGAAVSAASVALLGFGIDSFVESTSGAVLIWRLRAEDRSADEAAIEAVERRAQRLVAGSLLLLAAYISADAVLAITRREQPEPSSVGIGLAATSLVVMWWLAREKRRVASALQSRAMQADAFQTTACWWLSLTVLIGLAANAVLGWWWADPVAALGASVFIAREGVETWRDEGDCCSP